jgi:DNA-directed RNA polymerase subunit RPC12/RpoP
MNNVDDRKKDIRTPLKFYCPWCGNQVVANYIQIGETLNCPYCRIDITVPEYAERTSEDPNVSDVWSFEKPTPISVRKPTLAEKIKEKYLELSMIMGVICAVGFYIVTYDVIASKIHRLLISIGIFAWVSYTISAFKKHE